MNQNAIVQGSLSALSKQNNKSLAETFLSCDIVTIVDVSGSMESCDSRGERSRYDVACEELANLQANMPGKIAVIAFSNETQFCPGGKPMLLGGGTNLAGALNFCKIADVEGMRFFLISDGEPDNKDMAMSVAKMYKNRIDVIYVGPERESSGRQFLFQLAALTGGQSIVADRAKELAASVTQLLSSGALR